jgi:hypothetical protein
LLSTWLVATTPVLIEIKTKRHRRITGASLASGLEVKSPGKADALAVADRCGRVGVIVVSQLIVKNYLAGLVVRLIKRTSANDRAVATV